MVILAVILAVFVCILTVWAGDYRVSKNEDGLYTVQYNPEDYSYGPTLAPTMLANPGDKILFTTPACRIRAPMAAAIMSVLLHNLNKTRFFKVDTAALFSSQQEKGPDPRTLKVLRRHRIILKDHKIRTLLTKDFRRFHGIYAFDNKFKEEYTKRQPKAFFSAFAPLAIWDGNSRGTLEIPDPYYSDDVGFEECYQSILRACVGYLYALFTCSEDFLGVMPQYLVVPTPSQDEFPRVESEEIIKYNSSEQNRHHDIMVRLAAKALKKRDPYNWATFY
uniref:Low molecular weight phosphotyrosine protein phosphatase n=1 Tax=Cacopsylla melanoneura TaxID=428564 RepID=A0A8D8RR20_9HEMI